MPTRKTKDKHPDRDYNKHNLKNYKKSEIQMSMSERVKRRLTNGELILIRDHQMLDIELSAKIKRSVKAIHIARTKIKNGKYKIYDYEI